MEWHRLALPFMLTKEFDDTYATFVNGWANVKVAYGATFSAAVCRAKDAADPPHLAEHEFEADTRFIVRLCRELQALRPERPFVLGCRTLADAVRDAGYSMSHETAAARLRLLVNIDALVLAVPAVPGKRLAAEYRCPLPD